MPLVAVPETVNVTVSATVVAPVRVKVHWPGSPFSDAAASVAASVTTGRSSSVIVTVCVVKLVSVAPLAADSVSTTVSPDSTAVSSTSTSGTSLVVSPGAKLSVPAGSVESAPIVAVPPVTA